MMDLNSDLGESFGVWKLGDDEAMLELVTSANVACGFHAGDPTTLRRTCDQAVEQGVRIGAQVSYPDLVGFGRRPIGMEPHELTNDVLYQLGALDGLARVAGDRVRYVKPHGALYNTVVTDEDQAAALVEAVRLYDASLPVLGLPGSALLRQAAEAGLTCMAEAFADRAYTAEGHLVARQTPGAVLEDPEEIAQRCLGIVLDHRLTAIDGSILEMVPDSLCIHGDTPGAVAIARAVRAALLTSGVELVPFT